MSDVEVANQLFLILALAANVAVVVAVVLVVGSRFVPALADAAHRVVAVVGPQSVALAAFVGAVTTAGSLYYSEIAGFVPCELCWYQRICMYPLAAILVVAALRRAGDHSVGAYATVFIVFGAPLALYHWLVERIPALADSVACSVAAPCAVPWFEELGFVTLAYMDLSAFLLIATLLLLGRAARRAGDVAAKEAV